MFARPGLRAAPAVKMAQPPKAPPPRPNAAPVPAQAAPPPKVQPPPAVAKAQVKAAQQGTPEVQQKRLQATQAADQRANQNAAQAHEKQVQAKNQAAADAKAKQQQAAQNAAVNAQKDPAKANGANPAQAAGQNAGQAAPQVGKPPAPNPAQAAGQDAPAGGKPPIAAVKGEIDKGAAKAQDAAGKAVDGAVGKLADKLPGPLKGAAAGLADKAKAAIGDAAKGAAGDLKAAVKDGAGKLEAAAGKALDGAVAKLGDKLPGPLKDALAKGAEAVKGEVGKAIKEGAEMLLGKEGVPGVPGLPAPAGPGQAVPGVGAVPPGAPAGPAPAGGPKSGQLVKLSIKPEKGQKLEVQFNPAEYSVVKGTPWKHHAINGLDAPTLEFTSGEPTRLHFELMFDSYESGENIRKQTDKIEGFAHVHQELHRPAVLLLNWGTGLLYKCVLERYNVRYTLFTEAGVPVRAVVNCVFKEFSPREEQLRNAPRHSPDRTKRRVLKEGETLSGIAGREYEDPTQWRLIAEANGIMDPMSVKPGMELRIPPLIRHR